MQSQSECGFTLVEALVALAILATAAVALLGATEAHVARVAGLETRALAQIAAENRLVELELGLDAASETTEPILLGQEFRVNAARTATADPDLDRVDLNVTDAVGGTVLRGFVGFVDARVAP